jgi:outer membrane protein
MHAFTLSLCAGLGLMLAQPAAAQSNLRIGYVNVNYLLQNAPQTRAVDQKLRDEFGPREADLQLLQQELQTKLENYQRDASVLSEAERLAQERELQQGDRDLQRRASELQEDANIRQQELLNELQANFARRVQAFAVAQGFDLIVTNVLYASDAINITEQVFQAISADASPAASPSE